MPTNIIGTVHTMVIGSDWTGTAPDVAPRFHHGLDHYYRCAAGGLIQLPGDCWQRVGAIMLQLDGAVHGAAAIHTYVAIVVNGAEHIIADLTNEMSWVYPGGALVLPPASVIRVYPSGPSIPTIVQQLYVAHEPHRYFDPSTGKIVG